MNEVRQMTPWLSDGRRFGATTQSAPRQVFVHENIRLLGDLNGDGEIDNEDLLILLSQWGDCPCCAGDLDGDGIVGVPDINIQNANRTGD